MTSRDEIELGTSDTSKLTPEQWEHFKLGVIRRAQDARARALRDLANGMLTMLRVAARGGRSMARLVAGRAGGVAVDWWNARAIRRECKAAIRELKALDDRMLKDIGLGRSEIESVIRDPERLMTRELAFARRHQRVAPAGTDARSRKGSKPVIAPLIDKSAA